MKLKTQAVVICKRNNNKEPQKLESQGAGDLKIVKADPINKDNGLEGHFCSKFRHNILQSE